MGVLVHDGSKTLGEVLPQLAVTAEKLNDSLMELTTTKDEYGRTINAWEKQRQQLQSKLLQAENLVSTLQDKVDEADELLTAARDLVSDTLNSVGLSGFHKFSYSGTLSNFPNSITHGVTGMEAVTEWHPDSHMHVVMVVVGYGYPVAEKTAEVIALGKQFAIEGWGIDDGG